MPTLTWQAKRPAADPSATAIVMSSKFRLQRRVDVPRFLIDSVRMYRQMQRAEGALTVSLKAHPLRGEFFTLSAWRDRAALDNSVREEPHQSAMRRHRQAMAEAKFVFWEASQSGLPLEWGDAHQRIERA